MKNRILHIAGLDKFIPSFIELVHNNFEQSSHHFVVWGDCEKYKYKKNKYIFHYSALKKSIPRLMFELNRADKIIIHGLGGWRLAQLLACMPWLHYKCNWVMWGGDLYFHQFSKNEPFFHKAECYRRFLISRMGGLVTYVEGDFRRAVDWYGAIGKLYKCIMYTSNVFNGEAPTVSTKKSKDVTLLIGNSADPSNNHYEVFNKIIETEQQNRIERIYCPLSYGNKEYADQTVNLGKKMFGDKFIALTDFMPINEYNEILKSVDVAIFAHNRQQAMGNTINLLGMGKKVIMRSDTSSWETINQLGIRTCALDGFDITPIDYESALHNHNIIRNYFSEENLVQQLNKLFS